MNNILITVTGIETGETYLAKSYPDDDFNDNGKRELYQTPVYKVIIENEKKQSKRNGKPYALCLFGMTLATHRLTTKQEVG